MDINVLSLKWNNHVPTFLHVFSNLRNKASFTDATLVCNGRFYSVHRLVLSTCSEYFSEIFEQITCKHPVVILKDVDSKNIEYLLDYMYIGEVNVKQNELASLVETAECLKIKGLAVPDEESIQYSTSKKRFSPDSHINFSPPMKKIKTTKVPLTSHSSESKVVESEIDKPSFIAIKCEPNSDEEVVQENSILPDYRLGPNSDKWVEEERQQLLDNDTEKKEPLDPPDDINQLSSLVTNDNNLYMPESDASPQSHKEAMRNCLDVKIEEDLGQKSIEAFPDELNASSEKAKTSGGSQFLITSVTGVRFYKCSSCNYMTKCRRNAYRHAKIHTGIKPFSCEICRYKSAHSNNLKRHKLIHSDEKPFNCELCPYKASIKTSLERHMLFIHGTLP